MNPTDTAVRVISGSPDRRATASDPPFGRGERLAGVGSEDCVGNQLNAG
jgi:hypothetical protein